MQKRHTDRATYFTESATTARNHYLPYLAQFKPITDCERILEIGCGEGGNLFPFAQLGCEVTGIDLAPTRVKQARRFFQTHNNRATFIAEDFTRMAIPDQETDKFDIILLHDVIEHITDKIKFLSHAQQFLKSGGLLFVAFPAWQMPFGGHQQICRNKILARLPFVHLLPNALYTRILRHAHESDDTIHELLDIKACRTSIELFEHTLCLCHYRIVDRQLWLINPHYQQKFGLSPRKLHPQLSRIKYVRNFVSTSCFYLLSASPPTQEYPLRTSIANIL